MMMIEEETQPVDGFTVVGITTRTTNKDGKATDDINALWQKFFEDAVGEKIPHRVGEAIYAVYHDYEGDHESPYALTIGCRVEKIDETLPLDLDAAFVERGDYMIFAARGEQPKSLVETWQAIWKSDIKRSFRTDVEVYGPRFFEPDTHEILVCIGVEG